MGRDFIFPPYYHMNSELLQPAVEMGFGETLALFHHSTDIKIGKWEMVTRIAPMEEGRAIVDGKRLPLPLLVFYMHHKGTVGTRPLISIRLLANL